MIGAAKSAREISSRLWVREVIPGVPVALILNGRHIADSPLGEASAAISTATDHLHALARVIRLPEELGPSIATLARGTIESFGRAWWILDSPNLTVMEHRAAVMNLWEAVTAQKRGVATGVRGRDGTTEKVDSAAAVAKAQQHLTAVRVANQPFDIPGYTQLAKDVMGVAGVSNPGAEYSHLSGAAHGENLTTRGFSSVRDGVARLGLPYRYLDMYAWTVLHTVDLVVAHLIDLWDATNERERWVFQRDRTYEDFESVHTFVDQYEPERG